MSDDLLDQPHNDERRNDPPDDWPVGTSRTINGTEVWHYQRPDVGNVLACTNCEDPLPGGDGLLVAHEHEWLACSEPCAEALTRG